MICDAIIVIIVEGDNLPVVIPRTCTLFGSSGGVNVGAG